MRDASARRASKLARRERIKNRGAMPGREPKPLQDRSTKPPVCPCGLRRRRARRGSDPYGRGGPALTGGAESNSLCRDSRNQPGNSAT